MSNDVNLRVWTASDFSRLYLTHRAELVAYASRLASDKDLGEEAVQEAFLYLLTVLPEFDSEVGALKFLKWKTRFLVLDALRSSRNKPSYSLDSVAEPASESQPVDEMLIRLDEQALISMALAKIEPQYREALLKSALGEQPAAAIGAELGLNENATRQLLFRARRAFKIALIGEADSAGKSLPEIMSIAARRAAKASAQAVGVVASLVLLIAFATANLLGPRAANPIAAPVVEQQPSSESAAAAPQSNGSTNGQGAAQLPSDNADSLALPGADAEPESTTDLPGSSDPGASEQGTLEPSPSAPNTAPVVSPALPSEGSVEAAGSTNLEAVFASHQLKNLTVTNVSAVASPTYETIRFETANGLVVSYDFLPSRPNFVTNLVFELTVDGVIYKSLPLTNLTFDGSSPEGRYFVSGRLTYLADAEGNLLDPNRSRIFFEIGLKNDQDGSSRIFSLKFTLENRDSA